MPAPQLSPLLSSLTALPQVQANAPKTLADCRRLRTAQGSKSLEPNVVPEDTLRQCTPSPNSGRSLLTRPTDTTAGADRLSGLAEPPAAQAKPWGCLGFHWWELEENALPAPTARLLPGGTES